MYICYIHVTYLFMTFLLQKTIHIRKKWEMDWAMILKWITNFTQKGSRTSRRNQQISGWWTIINFTQNPRLFFEDSIAEQWNHFFMLFSNDPSFCAESKLLWIDLDIAVWKPRSNSNSVFLVQICQEAWQNRYHILTHILLVAINQQ